jgi:hypothetical protein
MNRDDLVESVVLPAVAAGSLLFISFVVLAPVIL